MIISSQGEACGPNEDIKALDLHGTNALRDRLLEIQANSDSGEEALLASAEIELGAEQEKQHKIEEAKRALQDFRDYLAQSTGKAAQALPSEEELEYSYNPNTQECEITRQDGRDIVLDLDSSHLQGELPLPRQLMVAKLYCRDNQVTSLPELPAGLNELECSSNQLTTLPELPARLLWLYCGDNQLTALPKLPTSLIELWCYENPSLASDPATQDALEAMSDRGGVVNS